MKEQHIVIISPFYNCKDYIERCIDSVASQNYKNYLEIIAHLNLIKPSRFTLKLL